MVKQLQSIFVSHLDKSALSQDLRVNNSEVIVDGLIENHVVHELVYLLSDRSDFLDSVDIDILKQLVNLVVLRYLLDQSPDKLN